ncbi:uncharacterized protein Z520_02524 [Fonsecaea multimorphosa CBS 102226]|uniref:Uncharacterized protein n=1 Tax=Fonsecaea multimorphosa CBS 102226 TaxID=1442371 RepID=A0A0D2HKJ6_9EURO|nr:uncharacterized protein Z520_02524 [Fonsecaea multimorphosa CBS 102226]KIY02386.1 hypothetical protein Z520_02524 [Fonsecaea multimorphosa CBS 102226]OAL29028.1 hypothetical protein AYO22_02464 [Fonsecaea multimorphosa]
MLETFAQQARQLLSDAVDLELGEPRCPECSHCRGLENNHDVEASQVVDAPTPTSQDCHQNIVMDSLNFSDSSHGTSQENPPTIPAGISKEGTRSLRPFELRNLRSTSLPSLKDDLSEGRATTTGVTTTTPNQNLPLKLRDDPANFNAVQTPLSDQTFVDYMDLSSFEFLNNHSSTATMTPSEESVPVTVPSLPCQDTVQGSAALHLAAREGRARILSILLRTGLRVDSRDERGRTPLHHCASHGHSEAAEVLLAAGANINAVDVDGVSVIIAAVKSGSEKMVELLLNCQR